MCSSLAVASGAIVTITDFSGLLCQAFFFQLGFVSLMIRLAFQVFSLSVFSLRLKQLEHFVLRQTTCRCVEFSLSKCLILESILSENCSVFREEQNAPYKINVNTDCVVLLIFLSVVYARAFRVVTQLARREVGVALVGITEGLIRLLFRRSSCDPNLKVCSFDAFNIEIVAMHRLHGFTAKN